MKWLHAVLFRLVLWMSSRFTSRPKQAAVFKGLSGLLKCIGEGVQKKGPVLELDANSRYIIFSDQHKGAKNGADDFMLCEPAYLGALSYYHQENFFFISLGDCEELWENTLSAVKKNQQPAFAQEKLFIEANRFIKIFGNHDLYWSNDPFASLQLKDIYGCSIPVYEGVLLRSAGSTLPSIFCTHGHQGDAASDGNWFSKFFVSRIWAPLQAWVKINPNTPAYDNQLKTLHNQMMYSWSSAQENLLLITGHTHQPVFASVTHIESLYLQLQEAEAGQDKEKISLLEQEITRRKFEYTHISADYQKLKPSYFNSGCCCFSDGDITGIEIAEGCIRLVKWHSKKGGAERQVLEERKLDNICL